MKLVLIRDFEVVRIIQKEWPASSYIKLKYAQKREILGWKTAKIYLEELEMQRIEHQRFAMLLYELRIPNMRNLNNHLLG